MQIPAKHNQYFTSVFYAEHKYLTSVFYANPC